jgi:arylsulfatase A-like enzyme
MNKILLLLATMTTLACASSDAVAASDARPNVVVLLADDLGFADVGVHGCADIPTPNIDRLAAQGVRCTSGYSSHPYCSPMRAGLMAVRYQHRFGYVSNIAYDPHNSFMGLPKSEVTVATRLKRAGYATGAFGKWHLGAAAPFTPNNRGFDYFYGFRGGGHDYFKVDLNRPMSEGYFQPLERNAVTVELDGYLTTMLADEAAAFIERQAGGPFFVYLAFNAPHTPMQAPEEYLQRFSSIKDKKRRAYAAMVSAMDDGIGKVLETLERLELTRNTVVFFLSDNGGPEHANASDNGPLRGQKGDVFEGGIRVPFLASWPGVLPQGTTYNEPVMSIDIMRTALEVGEVELDEKLEGVNLIPFLSGEAEGAPHAALFWRTQNCAAWAVRSGSLKLLKTAEASEPSLYDLAADLGETADLAAERPADVRRLRAAYEEWNRHNHDPFFPSFREYHPQMRKHYQEFAPP